MDDCWFEQWYQAATFSDHEEGHPGRESQIPIVGCPFCEHTCITKDHDGYCYDEVTT